MRHMRQRWNQLKAFGGVATAVRCVSTRPVGADAASQQQQLAGPRMDRFQRRSATVATSGSAQCAETVHSNALHHQGMLANVERLDHDSPASLATVVHTFRTVLMHQEVCPATTSQAVEGSALSLPDGLCFALIRALRQELTDCALLSREPIFVPLHWQALLACAHPSVRRCLPANDDLIEHTIAFIANRTREDGFQYWCMSTHDVQAFRWLAMEYDVAVGDQQHRLLTLAMQKLIRSRSFGISAKEHDAVKCCVRLLFLEICSSMATLKSSENTAKFRLRGHGWLWLETALPLLSENDTTEHASALSELCFTMSPNIALMSCKHSNASVKILFLSLMRSPLPCSESSHTLCFTLTDSICSLPEVSLRDADSLWRIVKVQCTLFLRPHTVLESTYRDNMALLHLCVGVLLHTLADEWPDTHANLAIVMWFSLTKALRVALMSSSDDDMEPRWYDTTRLSRVAQGGNILGHSCTDLLALMLRLMTASGKCVLRALPHNNQVQSRFGETLGHLGLSEAMWKEILSRRVATDASGTLHEFLAVFYDMFQCKPVTKLSLMDFIQRCAPPTTSRQPSAVIMHVKALMAGGSSIVSSTLHVTLLGCHRLVELLTTHPSGAERNGVGAVREWLLDDKGVDDALAPYLRHAVNVSAARTGTVRPDIVYDAVMNPARGGSMCRPYTRWLRDMGWMEPFPVQLLETLLTTLFRVRGFALRAHIWGPILHYALQVLDYAAASSCCATAWSSSAGQPLPMPSYLITAFPHLLAASIALGVVRVTLDEPQPPIEPSGWTAERRHWAREHNQTPDDAMPSSPSIELDATQCLRLFLLLPLVALPALGMVLAREFPSKTGTRTSASVVLVAFAQVCLQRLHGQSNPNDALLTPDDALGLLSDCRMLQPLVVLFVPCDAAMHVVAVACRSLADGGCACEAEEHAVDLVVQLMLWLEGCTPGYVHALGWVGEGSNQQCDPTTPTMCVGDALLCALIVRANGAASHHHNHREPLHGRATCNTIVIRLLSSNPLLLFRLWARLLDVPTHVLDMDRMVRLALGWLRDEAHRSPTARSDVAPRWVCIDDHTFIALLQVLASALPPTDRDGCTPQRLPLLLRISNAAGQLLLAVLEEMLDASCPLPFPTLMRLGQLMGRLHPDAPSAEPLLLRTVLLLDRASRTPPAAHGTSCPAPSELRSVSYMLCALRAKRTTSSASARCIADAVFRWTVPVSEITHDVPRWMSFVQSAMHPLLRKAIAMPLVEALEAMMHRQIEIKEGAATAETPQTDGGHCNGLTVSGTFDLIDLMHHHGMSSKRLSSLIVQHFFRHQRHASAGRGPNPPATAATTTTEPLTMRVPLLNVLRLLLVRRTLSSATSGQAQHLGVSTDAPMLQLHGTKHGDAQSTMSKQSVLTELTEEDLGVCCAAILADYDEQSRQCPAERRAADRIALQLEILSMLCDAKRYRCSVAADVCLQLLRSGAQYLSAADIAKVCIGIGRLRLWRTLLKHQRQQHASDASGSTTSPNAASAPGCPDIRPLLLSKFNDADGHTKVLLLRAMAAQASSAASDGEGIDASFVGDVLVPFVTGCAEASAPYLDEAEGLLSSLVQLAQTRATWVAAPQDEDESIAVRLLWTSMLRLYDAVVAAWTAAPMAVWRRHVGVMMVQVAGLLHGNPDRHDPQCAALRSNAGDDDVDEAPTVPDNVRVCVLMCNYALRRSGQSVVRLPAPDAVAINALQEDAGGPLFAIRLDTGQCLTMLQAMLRLDMVPSHGFVVQCMHRFEAAARDMPCHHMVAVLDVVLSFGFAWQWWMLTLFHRLHDEHRDAVRGYGTPGRASGSGRDRQVIRRFSMEFAVYLPPAFRAKRATR